jgi:hypothetical protein
MPNEQEHLCSLGLQDRILSSEDQSCLQNIHRQQIGLATSHTRKPATIGGNRRRQPSASPALLPLLAPALRPDHRL